MAVSSNKLKEIKALFMTYRNGIIADTLRSAGWTHSVIFGLNLPQITDIARQQPAPDVDLALELWNDRNVRESRLITPFLLPKDYQQADLLKLLADIQTLEEADIFAFRHIRHRADAAEVADKVADEYMAEAIRRFLS